MFISLCKQLNKEIDYYKQRLERGGGEKKKRERGEDLKPFCKGEKIKIIL